MDANPLCGMSDGGLMRRVAGGDVSAFESIHDRYEQDVFALALRMVRHRSAAEDVAQEAFLSLWRSAARYEPGRGSLKTWLLTLVRNRGIDSLRRSPPSQADVAIDDVGEAELEATDHIEGEFAKREHSTRVRTLLSTIPANQREVVELSYLGERTHVEIASDLKLPLGTVKGRLRLGHTKLHLALCDEAAAAA